MNHVIQRGPGYVLVRLPIRTRSEANRREHWAARHRRIKGQRHTVGLVVRPEVRAVPLPVVVRLVRIAPRALDDDNLRGALKAVRDSVADCYGVADGPNGPIRWEYDQRKGGVGEYGVEIAICRAQDALRRADDPPSGPVLAGD